MARLSRTALISKLNTYINTNGVGAITGAIANTIFKDLLSTSYTSLPYDPTINWFVGDLCSYDDGSGKKLYECNTDTTGTFNPTHWTTLSSAGNYIPLAGTASGHPVTGNVEFEPNKAIYGYDEVAANYYNYLIVDKDTDHGKAIEMAVTDDGSYYNRLRLYANGTYAGRAIFGNNYVSGFCGLEYESDYSAKFTSDRSIPDRGYNDARYMLISTYLTGGKIASAYLPSFVDDVLEYANLSSLPGTGETGKIYVTLDTNKIYRWSGSIYVEISGSPGSTDSVTEGVTNLYFTNARVLTAIYSGGSAISDTQIPYSNGSTLTGSASLTWINSLAQLNIGSGSNPIGGDLNVTKNINGAVYCTITNDHANGISGIIIGKDSGEYFAIQKYAGSRAGNFNGTSVPFADLTTFVTSKYSTLNNIPLLLGASTFITVIGTTGTNRATRFDNIGLRIGTLADIHTANTAILELPAGSATVAPLKLNAGTLKTSSVSGDIEFDGTDLYFTSSTPTRKKVATYSDDEINLIQVAAFRFLSGN